MKADELLTALKDDFMEHGMDAYKQFRRLGAGVDLTSEDLKYGEGSEFAHRDHMLALQRQERDKADNLSRVAKWIGFNQVGGQEAIDPSRISIDEPDDYKKHV